MEKQRNALQLKKQSPPPRPTLIKPKTAPEEQQCDPCEEIGSFREPPAIINPVQPQTTKSNPLQLKLQEEQPLRKLSVPACV